MLKVLFDYWGTQEERARHLYATRGGRRRSVLIDIEFRPSSYRLAKDDRVGMRAMMMQDKQYRGTRPFEQLLMRVSTG